MDKHPLVSVLCVSYNAERYVKAAIKSILEQTYKNIELVLADDHSTDDTIMIARAVAEQYPHRSIKILVNDKNLGITANCNVGLKVCTGEFICLFAADDLMYAEKIESQVDLMIDNPNSSLSYHGVDILNDEGKKKGLLENRACKYKTASDIIRFGGIPFTGSIMVRKSAVPVHGYDESIPSVSDWIFLIECSLLGEIVSLPGAYSAYRRHSEGASNKASELIEETIFTFDILAKRYPDAGLSSVIVQGKRRYLLGEVARNIKSGQSLPLRKIISSKVINPDYIVKFTAITGIIFNNLGVYRLSFVKIIFNLISRYLKS